jgi:glycine cleavage system transcriptional repressor
MRHFALSVVGRDRPGIAAAVSRVLLEHEGNVEDSQMTILRGHFTITLIVSTPAEVVPERLQTDLAAVKQELGLEAVVLSEVTEAMGTVEQVPSHIVSVYGVDHPGIVHAVTAALADRDVNITDLTTRLVGGNGGQPLYAMMMEVSLPEGLSAQELEQALAEVRERQGVEVTIRVLEQDAL